MSRCSVQINFDLAVPADAYLIMCESVVPVMLATPGLEWKLWIVAEDGSRAGGIYLFSDQSSAERYASGPVVQNLRDSPAVRNLEVRVTPVHPGLSARTAARGEAAQAEQAVAP